VGKGSLKVEAVLEKGTLRSKKANIYFKDMPKEIQNEAAIRIEESLKGRGLPSVVEEPLEFPGVGVEKPKEKKEKVQPSAPAYSKNVEDLLNEVDEEVIELTCPACGSLVDYQRGMTTCPACKRQVKFIAD
jgi:hypothetical protein